MRIAQLKLENVGVFENQVIELKPKVNPDKAEIHILTGVNGSGKSTILYALASAFTLRPKLLEKRFRYADRKSNVETGCANSTEQLQVRQVGYDDRNNFRYLVGDDDGYQDIVQSRLNTKPSHEVAFVAFAYSCSRTLFSAKVNSIIELEANPLDDALNFARSVDSGQLIQWIANTKAKAAFAQQEGKEEQASQYQGSLERIEEAIADIVGYPVEFGFSYEPIGVYVKVGEQELEFDLLPDGLKSIISWIADILMRLDRLKWVDNTNVLDRNFALFLDEIEIHLHPAWQRQILPVIQKLFKNAQIFIATHSPFVVASVSDAWVYRFDVKDGESELVSVEESKAGSSYVTVLDETFGIDEFFDPATEDEFDEFERLKQEVLSGNQGVLPELVSMAESLSKKSIEVQDIVARELRQLQRITPEELSL